VGATAELVDDANGFLLPPGDADELYRALLSLEYRTAAERVRIGEAGRRRALERFAWPVVTEGFINLFRSTAV
jgi:glycosyltransferase involved in cell wall biosynthesis